ncbi:protein spire homolog 2 [Puntigrus tetrazona]|uniref:protein spire homolog 2 n=1 Tax=Puntigrus tetrazona TaxID=1606681 RepID=UPI001C8A0CC8|nr:protein spire homolog 2 [Puntigrus tetrazona]
MMELSLYDTSTGHGCSYEQMSLAEMLELQDHPVSEEQAWALCYQLCRMLSHRSGEQTRRTAVSPAADAVLLSRDGGVCLRPSGGDSCVMETEEQAVEFVGRLVYLSLDWGLETQVERELSETLEILVCQMTKVNLGHRQPICSIADVIRVCEGRLYDPSRAAKHYRSVCSGLFSHTAELCQYLQIVQQSRKSLQKLLESETQLVARVTTDWVSSWRDLVDELSRGVLLRPLEKRRTVSRCPQPAETPPFNQLLQDIQCRRYTLRKVQLTDAGDGRRKLDPHQTLLEFIRSRPKLRPASERRIGLKPKEQISLHELLMEEIRSTDRCKRLAHNAESNYKRTETLSPQLWSFNLTTKELCLDDKEAAEERSFLKSAPHRIRSEAVGSGSDAQDASVTDFRLGAGKRRTRSFASNRDLFKKVKSSNSGSVLTTIVDVMKMHSCEEQADVKDLSCERYRDWRVCSCCAVRSVYFTWHNVCSVCRRVVCPGCCLEMRLPSKRCVNLPLSFFKQIVMKDGEQSQSNFWSERWSWNSVWIPLVLVSGGSGSSLHTQAMRDWYSQDLCVRCQKDLLQAHCPVTDSQEI